MDKVSVCIPTYEGERYVQAAIQSVLDQPWVDFELIICDDHSRDATLKVCGRVTDPRVHCYANSQRLGLVGNWNRCLDLAQGEYVTLFHQDDLMLPGNLARKVAFLENHPNLGFVFSNILRISPDGKMIGQHWEQQPENDCILSGQALFEMLSRMGNPISCPSVVVRKECYQRIGKFDPRLPFATDLNMWLRIARHYDIGYIAEPLIAQRVHPEQETSRFDGTGRDYWDILRALHYLPVTDLPEGYKYYLPKIYKKWGEFSLRMARWKLRQGKVRYSARYLAAASYSLLQSWLN